MPISYQLDTRERLVLARAWEQVSFTDLQRMKKELGDDPAFKPHFREVFDMRDVTSFDFARPTMESLCSPFESRVHRALVVGGPTTRAFAYIVQAYCEARGQVVQIFSDAQSARDWLEGREPQVRRG